ncbi:MAG TPA: DUF2058 family protein [Planctomycetes bacterium]|nr:DUF2058 family protein [Planctomycetota bacterium]
MGSLFDELKKAKLIDKKKAKQLAHESRVAKKKKGGGRGEELEIRQKREAFEAKKREEAERKRQESKRLQAGKKRQAELAALKQKIQSQAIGEELRGERRFFFVDEEGFIPFLAVSASTGLRLEAGELGIVRDPSKAYLAYCIVPRDVALSCKRLIPEWCRFLNGA